MFCTYFHPVKLLLFVCVIFFSYSVTLEGLQKSLMEDLVTFMVSLTILVTLAGTISKADNSYLHAGENSDSSAFNSSKV